MLVTATAMAQVIMYGSYTMWLMMPYLTEVWGFSITQAAAVVNIFDGVVAILPLGMKIFVNSVGNLVGDFWMLLLCGVSSTCGLALVTMSTPPVLARVVGTCNKYEPKCIGRVQRSLFYTGLTLLAIGMASCLTSLRPYIFNRAKKMGINKPKDIWLIRQALVQRNETLQTLQDLLMTANSGVNPRVLRNRAYHWPSELWLYRCNGVFTVMLVVLVFWVMPWSFRLGIPVIIMGLVTLLFVFKPWYQVTSDRSTNLIIDPSMVWTEVKTIAKAMMLSLPMWPAFIVCGLVSSVGNTYFIEQAGQMDPKLGNWNVPTPFFLLFYKLVNLLFSKLSENTISSKQVSPKVGIAICLIISTICCIVAALVERTRLAVVKRHDLIDNASETVPLSMFLMLPQFFLLGVLDGAYNCSVFAFFQERCSRSVKGYVNSLMHFVLGLGVIGNVFSVYLAGQVRKNWFKHTLNQSRLDNYYWLLTVLSAITVMLYPLVVVFYKYDKGSDDEVEQEETEGEVEELEFKRLDWFDLVPLRQ